MRTDSLQILDINREQGIRTEVHEEDGKLHFVKTYDAEPYLEYAAEARAISTGQNWGPMGRHVGVIPMAELGQMMRRDGQFDKKAVRQWLRDRPRLVTFDKYLK